MARVVTVVEAGFLRDVGSNVEALVFMDETGDTFEVQRALSVRGDEVATEWDTYCLVVGAAAVVYGGLTSWKLAEGVLTLAFTDASAGTLGLPSNLALRLPPSAEALAQEHLPRLLR